MSDENFEIKVQDKVSPGISNKLRAIASDATAAQTAIDRLSAALANAGTNTGSAKLLNQLTQAGLRNQKLQTEIYRTQTAMANMESALQRAIGAEARANASLERLTATQNKSAVASEKLAQQQNRTTQSYFAAETAMVRLVTAENNALTATQRLATEQQRTNTAIATTQVATARLATEQQRLATTQFQTATSAAQMQAAQVRVATAQVNNLTATQRLNNSQAQSAIVATNAAAAQTRAATAATQGASAAANLATAQTRGLTASQNLATAQQRTATATLNTATASSRAQAAALRLQVQQQRLAQSTNNTTQAFSGFIGRMTAIASSAVGVTAIVKMADAYTTLQNKLQNVTDSAPQVQILTDRLFDLANNTRTNIDSTATAFARFDRALKIMGKSQEDTLRMTETINKGLIVSGATTQEASSALLQLSQAFNAGKLQGDEFRSIAENMPMVLDAVAKALQVPINRVKTLSSEGKITSEVLYKAFSIMQQRVDAVFAKTNPTIGQSFVVLQNNMTRAIGQLDKMVGFSRTVSSSILWLSKNLDIVGVAAATAGALLLVAFGPAIIGAITAATGAVIAFTVALAANPFGLAIVAITAATAAIVAWGDKIDASGEGLYNLQDLAKGTWNVISKYASEAATAIQGFFKGAFDYIGFESGDLSKVISDFFSTLGDVAKAAVNFTVGAFVGGYNAIKVVWNNFPALVKGFFGSAYNIAATVVENIVNSWTMGFKLISSMVEKIMPGVAADMNAAMDKFQFKIPRMDVTEGEQAVDQLGAAFKDAFSKDYVGQFGSAVRNAAIEVANARKAMGGADNTALRGAGRNQIEDEPDKKAAKAAERRALALQKVNAQLDNEAARMFTLQPMRDAQAQMDRIEEGFIQKKIKLTTDEYAAIMKKIQANQRAKQVQQEYDRIYQEAVGPAQDYNNTLEAAQILLGQGAINQQQYAQAVTKAIIAYTKFKDPLYEVNKELDQQAQLMTMMPEKRAVETQMMNLQNQALQNGIVLTDAQLTQMRERFTIQEALNKVTQAYDAIYGETTGKQNEQTAQQLALNKAYADGVINLDNYNMRLVQLGIQAANLKLAMQDASFEDVVTASVGKIVDGYKGVFAGISDAMGDFFTTFTDGFANSIGQAVVQAQDLKSALYAVAQQAVSGLISALVKLGIQYAVNAALGNSLAATALTTQTALSTAAGAATAAAWAPAAAMVSLASFGANSAAAMAGITATNALTQAMSVASLIGFEEGGYTGNGGRSAIAGVVHGQEFVMDAAATQRIGVGTLQAMQNGATVQGLSDSAGGGGRVELNFTLINQAGNDVQFDVKQLTETDVEIIAKRTVAKDTDQHVASALANPNSKSSRALARNTTTARRRD